MQEISQVVRFIYYTTVFCDQRSPGRLSFNSQNCPKCGNEEFAQESTTFDTKFVNLCSLYYKSCQNPYLK